ncbi:hypothetical protein E4U42_000542 [Claviceps africana]|uniref:Uncharacterized protein n=1 Tax=Claviceps africana TaxID=83212 RepID=A0A8K0NE79_9HYPO|nr:hypothetical protein E4U42_000542 [Claviceps africana]
MPCCIAILKYRQCRHASLLKLGCTDNECGDGSICPPTSQRTLLLAYYTWSCDDCLTLRFTAEDDVDYDVLNRSGPLSKFRQQVQHIQENKDLDDGAQKSMITALWMRDEHRNMMVLKRRMAQLEEAQRAEEWLSGYGSAVFGLAYACRGQQDLAGRTAVEDGENDHERDQDGEEDETRTPWAKEDQTREQLALWLNFLWATKPVDIELHRDASAFYRRIRGTTAIVTRREAGEGCSKGVVGRNQGRALNHS